MKIDFIGIGAQRAGTTWIARCLGEHPSIFMSQPKELHYFDKHYDQGWAWYQNHFAAAAADQVAGEISPNYMSDPGVLERIACDAPHAKLFVVLREPVSRAYSAYQLFADRYTGKSFDQALAECDDLKSKSSYAGQMTRIYDLFPREQVHVALYDQLTADPAAYLRSLYQFLSVDPGFIPPSLHERYNRVMYPRVQAAIEKVGLGWAKESLKKTPLGKWIKHRHVNSRPSARANNDNPHRQVKEIFTADIRQLEKIIRKDLSCWQ